LVSERSALVLTLVLMDVELLVPTGSVAVEVTPARFVSVPVVEAFTVTTTVTVAVVLLVSTPKEQVRLVVPLQVPWLGVDELKVTPEGNVSVTVTPAALVGPALVTTRV
jgi:hypothetical protein